MRLIVPSLLHALLLHQTFLQELLHAVVLFLQLSLWKDEDKFIHRMEGYVKMQNEMIDDWRYNYVLY